MEENPNAGVVLDDEDDEIDYDEDGNAIRKEKKIIDPLPYIDHHEIEYPDFNKNFYEEHEEIKALNEQQVAELRNKLGIKVNTNNLNLPFYSKILLKYFKYFFQMRKLPAISLLQVLGIHPPKPVSSFGHFGLDAGLMKIIRKQNYTKPTPIQAQGVPVVMGGRDIIGIAKTGSGKTAAYLWPLLVHIFDQPELQQGDGPIGLIVAPTRELSQQIYAEAKKFGKVCTCQIMVHVTTWQLPHTLWSLPYTTHAPQPYNIRVVCAYGGGNLYEQCKACEQGAEVIVATPGRSHCASALTQLSHFTHNYIHS